MKENLLLFSCFITNRLYIRPDWNLATFQNSSFPNEWVGLFLSKVSGMGKLESYNAVASAMVGQSEVFITVKTIR